MSATSVPGLAAKPIIDIDVVVDSAEELAPAIERLRSLGYVYQGDKGIEGREAFMWPRGARPHHLYLVVQGSQPYLDHVQFRDYLRDHPEVASEYADLKTSLAEQHPDDWPRYEKGRRRGALRQEQVAAWGEYQQAPWGRLRLDLIRAVLDRHVRTPRRVLDVGCGFGELAVEFARAGSEVVATDASASMLAEAATRAEDAPVQWLAVEAERTAERFANERFDLVLCHNVLGYIADPARTCLALASLLAEGGSFSITVLNRVAEPLRQAFLLRDLDAALAAAEQNKHSRMAVTLGVESRLDSLDEATRWLEASGLRLEAFAGQLLVNHYLGAKDENEEHQPQL